MRAYMIKISMALLTGIISIQSAFAGSGTQLGPLAAAQREHRIEHAQELLGSLYRKSAVRTGEQITKVNGAVYRWTKEHLPKKYRADSQRIAQAIIDTSLKYKFDPILVLAVIQTESSFNPVMIGGVGEIGLMQIRPETAQWLAKKKGFKWAGKDSLRDPVTNIKIGCAYIEWLRERFDSHAGLYLAAYNMGPSNVRNLLEEKKWPKEYAARIMQNYIGYYEELKEPKG
jgi:soluble lytic murein transglycosylase